MDRINAELSMGTTACRGPEGRKMVDDSFAEFDELVKWLLGSKAPILFSS